MCVGFRELGGNAARSKRVGTVIRGYGMFRLPWRRVQRADDDDLNLLRTASPRFLPVSGNNENVFISNCVGSRMVFEVRPGEKYYLDFPIIQ